MSSDQGQFRGHLMDAGIAILGEGVRGSQTLLSYGLEIRKRLYDIGIALLRELSFIEVSLSDMVSHIDLMSIDNIAHIANKYPYVSDSQFHMAAGHEIPAYLFAKSYLKRFPETKLPLNFFNFGSVYRYPRNAKYPFNYGERKSFLECYSIHGSSEAAGAFVGTALKWNRKFVKEALGLPSIEVERPLITNKPVSKKTVCIDSILPLGATIITGMTYFHDDIFTKALSVKVRQLQNNKNQLVHSVHFGVSDNIFFSYLLNAHDSSGFYMLSRIAPYQISIIIEKYLDNKKMEIVKKLESSLINQDLRVECVHVERSKIYRYIKKNSLRGIPVTILIEGSSEDFKVKSRVQDVWLPLSKTRIEGLLHKNDEYIIGMFKEREKLNLVHCHSMNEVNQNVQKGKVARVFLANTNESILNFEAGLQGGEILGFQGAVTGPDLLTGEGVATAAFISRRI